MWWRLSSLPDIFRAAPSLIGGVSVREFGAVGDGVTDDLGAFIRASDFFGPSGGVVGVPPGKYFFYGTFVVTSALHLVGAGWADGVNDATQILAASNSTPISIQAPGAFVGDLCIAGTNSGTNQHGLIVNTGAFEACNLLIVNCGGDGVRIRNLIAGHMRRIQTTGCAGHGWNLSPLPGGSVNASTFTNCIGGACQGDSLHIDPVDSGTVHGNAWLAFIAEHAGGYGVFTRGRVKWNEWVAHWDEQNGASCWYVDGANYGGESAVNYNRMQGRFTSAGPVFPGSPATNVNSFRGYNASGAQTALITLGPP